LGHPEVPLVIPKVIDNDAFHRGDFGRQQGARPAQDVYVTHFRHGNDIGHRVEDRIDLVGATEAVRRRRIDREVVPMSYLWWCLFTGFLVLLLKFIGL
jgi:hypothetical protein